MKLRAEYDEIKILGDFFIKESEDLSGNIDDIKKLIEELSNYWKGKDYEVFRNNSISNITNMENTSIEFNAFGNALKKISGIYSGIDNDFSTKIKRVRNHD